MHNGVIKKHALIRNDAESRWFFFYWSPPAGYTCSAGLSEQVNLSFDGRNTDEVDSIRDFCMTGLLLPDVEPRLSQVSNNALNHSTPFASLVRRHFHPMMHRSDSNHSFLGGNYLKNARIKEICVIRYII